MDGVDTASEGQRDQEFKAGDEVTVDVTKVGRVEVEIWPDEELKNYVLPFYQDLKKERN